MLRFFGASDQFAIVIIDCETLRDTSASDISVSVMDGQYTCFVSKMTRALMIAASSPSPGITTSRGLERMLSNVRGFEVECSRQ